MTPTDDTNIPPEELPDDEELEDAFENFERFSAYVDEEMTPEARAEFERRLEQDEAFRADFEDFKQTMSVVQGLGHADVAAPDSFVEGVESRIRVRSRGRFFNDDFFYRSRVPYEVFAAMMLAIMAAILWFGEAGEGPRDDTDLAMAGSQQGKQPPRPDEGGDSTDAAPAEPDAGKTPAVAPVKREVILYAVEVTDADPQTRAEALADKLRKMDRRYQVQVQPTSEGQTTILVEVPREQLESLVASLAEEGEVKKERRTIAGHLPPSRTLTIRIAPP